MGISPELASLNAARFRSWSARPAARNRRSAVLAFRGDVYLGLRAETFDAQDMAFAQQHLRILSGLYGVLRPLDSIQAHRLEMGTRLATTAGRNLYEFWGPRIARALRRQAARSGATVLVNLASQEYFRAVDLEALALPVITPVFKEQRAGGLKIVSFSAKRARGMMAGFAIRNRITDPEELKKFTADGYRFQPALSCDSEWLFTRTVYVVFQARKAEILEGHFVGHAYVTLGKDDSTAEMCSARALRCLSRKGVAGIGPVPAKMVNDTWSKSDFRLIVRVNERTFDDLDAYRKEYVADHAKGEYQIGDKDCVTFTAECAKRLGLHLPERKDALFPSTFLEKLLKMN